MKWIIAIFLMISTTIAYAQVSYIPSQLDQFKKTGQCPGCDLTNTNIRYTTIPNVNLNNAMLTQTDMGHSNFSGANFAGANMLSTDLEYVNFSGSSFAGAYLASSSMAYGNFSRCDFSNADISGSDLSYAILIGSTITDAQLAMAKSLNCTVMPNGTRHAPDLGKSCG